MPGCQKQYEQIQGGQTPGAQIPSGKIPASLQSILLNTASLQSTLNYTASLQSTLHYTASLHSTLHYTVSLHSTLHYTSSLHSKLHYTAHEPVSTHLRHMLAKLLRPRLQRVGVACTSDMRATGGTVPQAQVGSELIILSIMVDQQTPCLSRS